MYFIPAIFEIDSKLVAEIVMCTKVQYEHYIKTRSMLEDDYLPLSFLKSFLSENGYELKNPIGESTGLAVTGEKYIYEYLNVRFIALQRVKEILQDAGVSYEDFIDKYAQYLKTK